MKKKGLFRTAGPREEDFLGAAAFEDKGSGLTKLLSAAIGKALSRCIFRSIGEKSDSVFANERKGLELGMKLAKSGMSSFRVSKIAAADCLPVDISRKLGFSNLRIICILSARLTNNRSYGQSAPEK
jgi:hypothetical protein